MFYNLEVSLAACLMWGRKNRRQQARRKEMERAKELVCLLKMNPILREGIDPINQPVGLYWGLLKRTPVAPLDA